MTVQQRAAQRIANRKKLAGFSTGVRATPVELTEKEPKLEQKSSLSLKAPAKISTPLDLTAEQEVLPTPVTGTPEIVPVPDTKTVVTPEQPQTPTKTEQPEVKTPAKAEQQKPEAPAEKEADKQEVL